MAPYLPPRSAVTLDRSRGMETGFNGSGKRYYTLAAEPSGDLITIECPTGYGIDSTKAAAIMAIWDAVATPITVVENYSTVSGKKKTWSSCSLVEYPQFRALDGAELQLFYSYRLVLLCSQGVEDV